MNSYPQVVQELVDKIQSEDGWTDAFKAAVASAKENSSESLEFYGITDLESFYDFITNFLYWAPAENSKATGLLQKARVFYFVFGQPSVQGYQTAIKPAESGPLEIESTWLSDWLTSFVKGLGAFLDTPESITPETIQTFYTSSKYRMQDYPVPPGGWHTFNEFFARQIDPALRPIADPSNNQIATSPVDAIFKGSWTINSDNQIEVKDINWSISDLLKDTNDGHLFAEGTLLHFSLEQTDYHRVHAPVEGTVVRTGLIQAQTILDAIVSDGELVQDPETETGYQWYQTRAHILIDSPELGLVGVVPVGLGHISSVVLTTTDGSSVQKGDELAFFQYGGSDVLLLFQKDANVQVDLTEGSHYNFGEVVASKGD